jgi:Zn-dependent peptidase ImmA (M78 family)
MNKLEIECKAQELQVHIWQQRRRLWPEGIPCPVDMLDPEIAANVLGVNFEYHEELGRFGFHGTRFEIAGLLDRQACKIAVSRKFSPETIRFTGAHEIGHWLLHPGQVMHRDRPIKGLDSETSSRAPQEKDADYFAACFVMPRRLVTTAFESTFSVNVPFIFDDATAFRLCPNDPDSLLRPDSGSLDRALSLASAQSYGGRYFKSLSKQFRVSVTTMAIRLNELELIQE